MIGIYTSTAGAAAPDDNDGNGGSGGQRGQRGQRGGERYGKQG